MHAGLYISRSPAKEVSPQHPSRWATGYIGCCLKRRAWDLEGGGASPPRLLYPFPCLSRGRIKRGQRGSDGRVVGRRDPPAWPSPNSESILTYLRCTYAPRTRGGGRSFPSVIRSIKDFSSPFPSRPGASGPMVPLQPYRGCRHMEEGKGLCNRARVVDKVSRHPHGYTMRFSSPRSDVEPLED